MEDKDITPEDSIVPIYLFDIEQEEIDKYQNAELEYAQKNRARYTALAKLQKLGLTEEEAKAITGV